MNVADIVEFLKGWDFLLGLTGTILGIISIVMSAGVSREEKRTQLLVDAFSIERRLNQLTESLRQMCAVARKFEETEKLEEFQEDAAYIHATARKWMESTERLTESTANIIEGSQKLPSWLPATSLERLRRDIVEIRERTDGMIEDVTVLSSRLNDIAERAGKLAEAAQPSL